MSQTSSWSLAAGGVVLAAVATLGWLRHRYLVVTVHGASMEPTYRAGEQLVVRRTPDRALRSSAVVVLRDELKVRVPAPAEVRPRPARSSSFTGRPLGPCIIKRAVAVPGDPLPRDTVPALRNAPESSVPPGKLVLLGDNAQASYDSREHGYYTTDRLLGVVIARLGHGRSR
ncbi:S26 family signal peptidase [Plantactinospora sp. S1510]|uniref:S26 family signal peptidase n=1 Tax=Plantactinospora alkalitolerans TaxID=2789879 RepID=A0ABS0H6W9_9ACTN|nr:S26 family signal peptidase [Plantactinospora alkalitolerans]MBF9134216.1 S26 family signal peptidase [Plantactinospora alkalitolerans]